MPLPPIIDAHHHFYDLSRFRYPFLDDPEFAALRRSYGPADFRADIGDLPVIGSVHCRGIDRAYDPVAETAWLEAEGNRGLPSVAVAYADLRRADLADLLARHAAYPFVPGIRQEAWFGSMRADIPHDDLPKHPTWRSGYRRLADFGLSFDLLVWPWQLGEAARLVAEGPEVPVMVEQHGLPGRSVAGRRPGVARRLAGARWRRARVPQTLGDEPARACLDDRGSPPLHPRRHRCLRPDRCMFGSNFPVERLSCGYARLWQAYAQVTTGFSAAERRDLFAGTAARAYRIGG